jgi:hypothetical protein
MSPRPERELGEGHRLSSFAAWPAWEAYPVRGSSSQLMRPSGKQEAQLIAMRLGSPPKGYANWTLRLLARKLVELEIVPAISHETVRQTLKKAA